MRRGDKKEKIETCYGRMGHPVAGPVRFSGCRHRSINFPCVSRFSVFFTGMLFFCVQSMKKRSWKDGLRVVCQLYRKRAKRKHSTHHSCQKFCGNWKEQFNFCILFHNLLRLRGRWKPDVRRFAPIIFSGICVLSRAIHRWKIEQLI